MEALLIVLAVFFVYQFTVKSANRAKDISDALDAYSIHNLTIEVANSSKESPKPAAIVITNKLGVWTMVWGKFERMWRGRTPYVQEHQGEKINGGTEINKNCPGLIELEYLGTQEERSSAEGAYFFVRTGGSLTPVPILIERGETYTAEFGFEFRYGDICLRPATRLTLEFTADGNDLRIRKISDWNGTEKQE